MSRQAEIHIGVCGWGDHDDLYTQGVPSHQKLAVYASHFPIVEVDSSFYAILPQKNYEKWAQDTPERFGFIVKPYGAITRHMRNEGTQTASVTEWIKRFEDSIQPLVQAGKCKALLLQFPPWFDCRREHVQYIQYCVQALRSYPLAVEFRHQSWFSAPYREKTLSFLRDQGVTHVCCDEPQAGPGSVPIVIAVTQPDLAMVRFHGRNTAGWRAPQSGQEWRDVRYLYDYREEELAEWVSHIRQLAEEAREVCILFNNNSGKHAVKNAKQLMDMLGVEPKGLHPRQMELF
jgi:uncharacterized protein YecE (DUF72 family)